MCKMISPNIVANYDVISANKNATFLIRYHFCFVSIC